MNQHVVIDIQCPEEEREFLIAEFSFAGAEAFQEEDQGFIASFDPKDWNQKIIDEIIAKYNQSDVIRYTISQVSRENWNLIWEKNFDPIVVDHSCRVRAPFHPEDPSFRYEIIVRPQMSFGTGHHATTQQMMSLLLEQELEGKRVLDIGTGTGILAILALKLGAAHVEATDVDDWCKENSLENLALNGYHRVSVHLGEISTLPIKGKYDFVLANINKNVLLEEMAYYVDRLVGGGSLLISGFYQEDIPEICGNVENLGLVKSKESVKANWAAVLFNRPGN